MSASESTPTEQSPGREVAKRVFASEFNDGTFTFKESDDDRAPVYQLLPTGEKANRVFIIGTLTDTNDVGEDSEYWQGRIVDPTGTVFVYAGQYQPEAAAFLRKTEPPAYVAVTGKPRTFEGDDGEQNVSIRPESIVAVDEETRNRWVKEAADRTLDRIEDDAPSNPYNELVAENYDDVDPDEYTQMVIEAVQSLQDDGSDQEAEQTEQAPQ